MNKKTAIQISLIFTIAVIFVIIFLKYFDDETEVKKKLLKGNISKVTEISKENSNIIKDIKYLSEDNLGNTYKINAKTGEINNDNPDIILLKNVIARISIVNSDDIFIYADFAKYNNKNYNTNFYENIKVEYIDHKINCKYLDLLFNKNLALLREDIIYKSLKSKLFADTLEIDLITKNSKISMKDKKQKIKVVYNKLNGNY